MDYMNYDERLELTRQKEELQNKINNMERSELKELAPKSLLKYFDPENEKDSVPNWYVRMEILRQFEDDFKKQSQEQYHSRNHSSRGRFNNTSRGHSDFERAPHTNCTGHHINGKSFFEPD